MRLWHRELIPVLPRQQLLGQWRECCLIAKRISENGTPNHILVNPVTDYDIEEFLGYCKLVANEMDRRGYTVDFYNVFRKLEMDVPLYWNISNIEQCQLYKGWHNNRYLNQCLSNLQEKHDRGGISDTDWKRITDRYPNIE